MTARVSTRPSWPWPRTATAAPALSICGSRRSVCVLRRMKMGKTTIEWTDATWNPVTGCTKVSQGCKNCYAERVFPRAYGKTRKFTDVKCHYERLRQPLHWRNPRRIFVNSMSDLFHEDVPPEFLLSVFDTMYISPMHTFQILTKRPGRMF